MKIARYETENPRTAAEAQVAYLEMETPASALVQFRNVLVERSRVLMDGISQKGIAIRKTLNSDAVDAFAYVGESGAALISHTAHWFHQRFMFVLLGAYLMSAFAPQAGLALRHISFGSVSNFGPGSIDLSIPLLLLSILQFNAGMGIKTKELKAQIKNPTVLIAGFIANLLIPVVLIVAFRGVLSLWLNPSQLQNLLIGIALIAAMPIAPGSSAWSQNSNGNLSLSLGLVFFSALLSPITTPAVLNIFSWLTTGDYSAHLHELSHQGTDAFMCIGVVLPAAIGICVNLLMGEKRVANLKSVMKLSNMVAILLLVYSNAATVLPKVIHQADWSYLACAVLVTSSLCVVAFVCGWVLSNVFKTGNSERVSLMYSLGMNNNGTGLVLASVTMAAFPGAMLPIVLYSLIQQIVAAVVDRKILKESSH